MVSTDNDNVVVLSWLISRNATKYVGSLNFAITFKCVSDDGNIDYAWSTAIFTGISVCEGMNNTETVVEEYSDVLEQWRQKLLNVVPQPTTSDAGKVLTVSDAGNAIWENVVNSEEVAY